MSIVWGCNPRALSGARAYGVVVVGYRVNPLAFVDMFFACCLSIEKLLTRQVETGKLATAPQYSEHILVRLLHAETLACALCFLISATLGVLPLRRSRESGNPWVAQSVGSCAATLHSTRSWHGMCGRTLGGRQNGRTSHNGNSRKFAKWS